MARPALVDRWGDPIRPRALREVEAELTLSGVLHVAPSRPSTTPTPERMAAILRAAEVPGHGAAEAYVDLAETMEERDLHYLGTLQTRRRQVAQIGVTIEPASDAAEDVRDADLVRTYFARDEIEDELYDVLDAVGKGYSVTEIIWDVSERQWMPMRLAYRLPRWFDFDPATGARLQLRTPDGHRDLTPWKYLTHLGGAKSGIPIRGGLARIAAWSWLFRAYAVQDWARFCEAYGMPIRIGWYGPEARPEEIAVLKRAVRDLAADAAAVLPEGMRIEFAGERSVQGRAEIYRDLAEYLDRQVSIAVLGQTLTTEQGQSGSYALGAVHNLVRADIERSDGRQLAAALRRDLVIPAVALNHGPRERYPIVTIQRETAVDVERMARALADLVPLGLRVRADEVRSRLRLSAPGDDDEVLSPPAPPAPPDPPPRPEPPPARAGDAGGDPPPATGRDAADAEDDPTAPLAARVRETLGPLIDAWADRLRREVGAADSFAVARDRLAAAREDPDAGAFAAALSPALIAAHLAGRYDVLAESGELAAARDGALPVALAGAAAEHARLPFGEQIEFFREKTSLPTESWSDLWHDEHDRAFVVAGAAHDDLVADLRGAVDKAVAEGTTLAEFRRDFDAAVAKHGWSYRGARDWRTRVIYQTNLKTSYAAGRYRQMKDAADRRPYWRYRHSGVAEHPRHQHVAWDGLVLRHDDPWWETHYPPNGWGCGCYVESLNERGLKRLHKSGPDRAPPVREREVTVGSRGPTPRTVRVPEGIDPGWAYAPGAGQRAGGPLLSPAEYTLAGREIRGRIDAAVQAAGVQPGGVGHPPIWRAELRRRLRDERGAGATPARATGAGHAAPDVTAARHVRRAAEEFPRSWVERGNRTRLSVQSMTPTAGTLGDYRRPRPYDRTIETPGRPDYALAKGRGMIRTAGGHSVAVHEYAHHLQETMPELDGLFRRLHVRRTTRPDGTTRDPIVPLPGYPGVEGREDRYADAYFGTEYPGPDWPSGPMEVMTRTCEMVFRATGAKGVATLMKHDPEILDFALGLLFRYDPS